MFQGLKTTVSRDVFKEYMASQEEAYDIDRYETEYAILYRRHGGTRIVAAQIFDPETDEWRYVIYDTLLIKYLSDVYEDNPITFTGGRGKSAWMDVRAAQNMTITPGEICMVPLGFAMQLPDDYEAILAPRSSTPKKYDVMQANSIGIIDDSYCGDYDEWKLCVYGIGNGEIVKGDRIAQFRIQEKMPEIETFAVSSLGNVNRGGFGSSGVK